MHRRVKCKATVKESKAKRQLLAEMPWASDKELPRASDRVPG